MAIKASTNADQGATHQCRMSDQVTEVQKAQSTYPESRPIAIISLLGYPVIAKLTNTYVPPKE